MKEPLDAIRAGDPASVNTLLDKNPHWASASDEAGLSALMCALYARKPDIASLLLERGAQLDIFTASASGNADHVRHLLAANKSLVKSVSNDGWTPLHLAAFFGQTQAARDIFQAGADINARSINPMQNQPIHAGVAGRNVELIRLLIDWGADVNAKQHGGWTPLHAAAQNGDLEAAAALLDAGADWKLRADNNQTALDLALGKGHQTMVELLEKRGARL